ncbi:DUF930 domain-containing protein [Ensifer sp. 4252]|uniref:DUF930 domain-containing protein n=1 Tax=Ensifer sp. 4252 TaxID=3373915 RepID=UPI003D237CD3
MQLFSEKWWEKIRWGTPTSVGLHLLVIFLVLFRLPDEAPKPEGEQSINVEIVSAPQPKQEEKPKQEAQPKKEQPKPQPAPARQQPPVFESAAAKIKQEAKAAQLPPTAKAEKKDVVNQPKKAEAAAAVSEKAEAKAQKQPEAEKPAPQQLAVLSSSANGEESAAEKKPPAEADAEKAVPKADPVPVRKPVDNKEKSDETEGKAEAKAKLPSDRFVEAEELFSAKSIADPRVKQAMGQLPVKKRILQLCSIEALEQIRHERPKDFPDMLVPFGPSGGFIGKEQIDASGGAYRSKGNWYDVNFRCKVNLETVEVVSFSYAIGGIVPETAWKSRKLPTN